eukprot:392542_1
MIIYHRLISEFIGWIIAYGLCVLYSYFYVSLDSCKTDYILLCDVFLYLYIYVIYLLCVTYNLLICVWHTNRFNNCVLYKKEKWNRLCNCNVFILLNLIDRCPLLKKKK